MATPKKSSSPAKADHGSTAASPKSVSKTSDAADKPVHVAPVVNLTHAAQSAAMLLAARNRRAKAADGESSDVNAATFKKLKDALGQPQHAATSPLAGLNKAPKPTGSAGYNRPGGHHQNATANVARTGVPRRTSGG